MTRNSGRELYVGNPYIEGVILAVILFIVLSVASSLSILNTLTLIRRLRPGRFGILNGVVRMLLALCVGALIDICSLVTFWSSLYLEETQPMFH